MTDELFPPLGEGQRKSYAGIGSRETPQEICDLMTRVASVLEQRGYVLRSGGAVGADVAFAAGVQLRANKQIFLPWAGFNYHEVGAYPDVVSDFDNYAEAVAMAERYHPAWHRCGPGARKLHARNCYQILGRSLRDPCHAVVCWTRNGRPVGGTGQALRIAEDLSIPIYNLCREEDRLRFEEMALAA